MLVTLSLLTLTLAVQANEALMAERATLKQKIAEQAVVIAELGGPADEAQVPHPSPPFSLPCCLCAHRQHGSILRTAVALAAAPVTLRVFASCVCMCLHVFCLMT